MSSSRREENLTGSAGQVAYGQASTKPTTNEPSFSRKRTLAHPARQVEFPRSWPPQRPLTA
jgi:hypothetical protein